MNIGWLIYNKQDAEMNESYIEWFISEAKKQDVILKLILRENLLIGIDGTNFITYYNNQPKTLPHFCIIRVIDSTIQSHFMAQNVLCFNNYETSIICNDKSATHIEIAKLGVPAVQTFHYGTSDLVSPPIPYPFILKSVNGRGGNQVYLVDNDKKFLNVQNNKMKGNFIIQSTHVEMGKDLRVFIIGKKIIAAVLRESKNDFRANFKLGGSATLYTLNKNEINLVKKIVNHFDFGLVGIDFLLSKDGQLLFNEIEDVVGSRILSKTTDINLLKEYILYIKSFL